MKALWFGFMIATVVALNFCVTIICLVRIFFWFLSDTFKKEKAA